ncbi:YbaK/EbsC family protein [Sporomusa sphaeroides]|uniref:YbaK/EbsC family protein n=1 Tax=Sporomusa sphaeroides TaxID=47679 RepID=UPI002CCA81F2|nr:YbaK/EbsC family protein [Sporomusa sphaeroides]HML35045.1 YbaK/EbsC family protein [Sporomusa sphaeroides]
MSLETVKMYFAALGRAQDVREFAVSSATVDLAAQALNVEPARIAKTLSFQNNTDGNCILVVAAGDAKVDNGKFKRHFGLKPKMLTPDEVAQLTGHAVGGVCPFANPAGVKTCLDISLKRFATVFPACGSSSSAIELNCDELYRYAQALEWVDVCKSWQSEYND